jgi:hypothetical protein
LFDRCGGGRGRIAIGRRAGTAAVVGMLAIPAAASAVSPAVRAPTTDEQAAKPYYDSREAARSGGRASAVSSK